MKNCCEDDDNWHLLEDKGCFQQYQCKVCGEKFSVHGDFPIILNTPPQRCNLYVEWSKESSLVSQINTLKKLIPHVKKLSNTELLNIAKSYDKWFIDEMYLSEAQKLVTLAKEQNLILVTEKL